MARLALSDDDAKVRRWFADEVTKLGCALTVDQLGNMFARTPGSSSASSGQGSLMTAMGSHLDTQPRGGRYDGILGVMAGLEVLRTLKENGHKTNYDIGLINWTNEEGARFPKSMLSSAVWAGQIPVEQAHALGDIFSPTTTVQSELQRIGFLGDLPCSHEAYPLAAHFELHIEQGPILERKEKKIGVVQGGQAYKWLTFTVKGRDAHTGTTPLDMRSDSILAAAKMIAASNAVAKEKGALASTGVLKIPPGSSTNTLASQVTFTLDVRHPDDAVVSEVLDEILTRFNAIAKEDGRGVSFDYTLDTDSPAAKFDKDCIAAVQSSAEDLFGADGWLPITSGAGHDTVCTSSRCPSTMIFVPCRDGVSHHPEEYCSPEDW